MSEALLSPDQRRYRQHRARSLEIARRSYLKRRQKVAAYGARYRAQPENKERAAAYSVVYTPGYLARHWPRIYKVQKSWRDKNRSKLNAMMSRYRLKNKVACAIRVQVASFLTNGKGCWRWLPYTRQELEAHLVSKFPAGSGFTLQNHGKVWAIDHIKPVAQFKKELGALLPEHIPTICALSNLQPLSKEDNQLKRASWDGTAENNSWRLTHA